MSESRIWEDTPDTTAFPPEDPAEPFGETPYPERIAHYAKWAWDRKLAGETRLSLRRMPGLAEARAAVLGARSSGILPVVSLCTENGGVPAEREELLAALLCLQELGIAAFGLDFPRVTDEVAELFDHLAPYAQVPLLARPESPADAAQFSSLLRAGAEYLACGQAAKNAAFAAIAATPSYARPPRPEDSPLLLCDGSGVYYLEEDFTLSDEMECSLDMAGEILKQEDLGYDALCFLVETVDDAHFFGLNAHLARCAVCVRAAGPEALEMALLLYSGRALIDSRSEVEKDTLHLLARQYGALIR